LLLVFSGKRFEEYRICINGLKHLLRHGNGRLAQNVNECDPGESGKRCKCIIQHIVGYRRCKGRVLGQMLPVPFGMCSNFMGEKGIFSGQRLGVLAGFKP
jgi:hypothetical protein